MGPLSWVAPPLAMRAALIHLGGFWLSLAHAPPAHIDSAMAARIAAMERIQAELLGVPPTLH